MAGQYIGVANVARKIKNEFIGVAGVARKVKSEFIGVAGVARKFFQSGLVLYDNGNNEGGLTGDDDVFSFGSSYITVIENVSGDITIPASDVSEYRTLNITFTPTFMNLKYISFKLHNTGSTTYWAYGFSGTINTKQTFSIDISDLKIKSTKALNIIPCTSKRLVSTSNVYSTISGYIYKIWFE